MCHVKYYHAFDLILLELHLYSQYLLQAFVAVQSNQE